MSKGTTKSGGQKNELDKFYTKPEIAKYCLSQIPNFEEYTTVIEPSAGNGSFSNLIPQVLAFDLAPEHSSIIKQDWLQYERPRTSEDKILIVGNPPFGQQNTLSLKFINHSASFATTIAFILPISFQKVSIQQRVHNHFHLTHSEVLPKNSFLLHGKDMSVPCVFQIWNYSETPRPKLPEYAPVGWSFVKKNNTPDFAIQRVGGNAGRVKRDWGTVSEQSHYFVSLDKKSDILELRNVLEGLQYPERDFGVGPRSLSKREILSALTVSQSTFVKRIDK